MRPVRASGNLLHNPQPVGPVPWNLDVDSGAPPGYFWIGESQGDGPIGPHGPWPGYGAALPIVTRCYSLLADPLTAGPFRIRTPGDELEPAPRWLNDPQMAREDARILGERPERPIPESVRMTRAKFWRTFIAYAIGHGISYLMFEESPSGQPVAGSLRLPDPRLVETDDSGHWRIGELEFDREGRSGNIRMVALRNPHHSQGVFVAHPETFQIAGRIERYTKGIFRSGVPAGYLKVSNPNLSAQQAKQLKDAWMQAHASGDARTIAVLNATVDFHAIALSPVDAALAEVRRLSIADAAFAFNIAPETLGLTLGNSATYSNVAQWFEAHRDFSLSPWIAAVQDCLTALVASGNGVEVNLDAMAAPPLDERMRAWEVALRAGVMTVNEVRAREGLPPLPESRRKAPSEPVDGSQGAGGSPDAPA